MSFCRNCGTNVGESKFCPQCGTPNTVSAPAAAPTAAPTPAPAPAPAAAPAPAPAAASAHSEYYPMLCEYNHAATVYMILGIVSLIFSMGIGFIFEIVMLCHASKINRMTLLFKNEITLTNPEEIASLQTAQRNARIGGILGAIAIAITGILLFILFFTLAIGCQL